MLEHIIDNPARGPSMTRSPVRGRFEDKAFKALEVELDGSSFVRCKFENCKMTYAGGIPPVLSGCQFDDCAWGFAGEAANTIAFLSGFYTGGFEDLVEATFHQIRKGAMITQSPADDSGSTDRSKLHGARPIFGLPGPRLYKIPKRKSS